MRKEKEKCFSCFDTSFLFSFSLCLFCLFLFSFLLCLFCYVFFLFFSFSFSFFFVLFCYVFVCLFVCFFFFFLFADQNFLHTRENKIVSVVVELIFLFCSFYFHFALPSSSTREGDRGSKSREKPKTRGGKRKNQNK